MNRFFVDKLSDNISLCGENHTHIAYSLRLKVGEDIILFCGDGCDYRYRIVSIKKNETLVEFVSKDEKNIEADFDLAAFLSIIKHDKMSFTYQKLTELGVKEFFPIITRFTQGKKKDFNEERYSKICIEACKQCGRSVLPKINSLLAFADACRELENYDLVVFAYENATKKLKDYLLDIKSIKKSPIKKIAVLIGPEGGFSADEVDTLIGRNIFPLSLGKRILRAETAAIAAVSAVLYELDW